MSTQREFIAEICAERGIKIETLSGGYVTLLHKDSKTRRFFGPYWDINSAAADRIACDKTACYILMQNAGLPAIPHYLVFNPMRRLGICGADGAWSYALGIFEKFKRRMVIKPNQGTKGEGVFLCEDIPSFEAALQELFLTLPDAALSPYFDISTEYRVFYLHGKAHYFYGKKKGDSWQHNLSQGATAELCPQDDKRARTLSGIAIRAANAIGINFATIDIALTHNRYRIMEVNAGVQAKKLLEQHPHLRETIKGLYAGAIDGMFG